MQIVSYGGGTNSTAMLIEMAKRKECVDLILFSDTGGERPETYKFIGLFCEWLTQNGLPGITRVRNVRKSGKPETLEENCLRMANLPSVAYGFKQCSQKFKAAPQDKFVNNWPPALAWWARGEKITKCVGFDADEPHRAREFVCKKYETRYPLIEWGMGRDECVESIQKAGLPLPGKSSCFFCPNSKAREILALPDALKERAIAMERNARLTSLAGLGRRWRWEDLIASDRAQMDMFCTSSEMPCGCYDGGE